MADEDAISPSTLAGTETAISIGSKLVLEVLYRVDGGGVRHFTLGKGVEVVSVRLVFTDLEIGADHSRNKVLLPTGEHVPTGVRMRSLERCLDPRGEESVRLQALAGRDGQAGGVAGSSGRVVR